MIPNRYNYHIGGTYDIRLFFCIKNILKNININSDIVRREKIVAADKHIILIASNINRISRAKRERISS